MLQHHPIGGGLLLGEGVGLGGLNDLEDEEEGQEEEYEDDENGEETDDDDAEEHDPVAAGGGTAGLERRYSGRLHYLLSRYLFALFDFSPRGKHSRETKLWPGEAMETLYLSGPKVYSCSNCRTHVSTDDDVISRAFQGRGGRAFLFEHVVNVVSGPTEDRILMTGLHKVADIFCQQCKENLGWKYEEAFEESQKYKEGRFILEKVRIMREGW